MIVRPTITKRAMIDVGLHCNAACKFCYYHHLGDLTKQEYKSVDQISMEISLAHARGCNYIDFSGGEPMLHPALPEIISNLTKHGTKCCVITNATCGINTLQKVLDAGGDDFLISIHGTADVHDKVVGIPNARNLQLNFIQHLRDKNKDFRFNCVIGAHNQYELFAIASLMSIEHPAIVNFINFNPHGDWANDVAGIRATCANLNVVEDGLNSAIDLLEHCNIGVNVRYYPMCKIAEEYRKCICNDLHVMFDPYEWDNEVNEHTFAAFKRWGEHTSSLIEWQLDPCRTCSLRKVCGGINKAFNAATFGGYPEPVTEIVPDDFYFYRQHNYRTLHERGML